MMQSSKGTLWECVEQEEPLPQSLAALLRMAYFAGARETALRYRVSVEEALAHLHGAGVMRTPRPERAADNMRCVVHATALVRGDAQAWVDVLNQLGPSFDRACASRLDQVQGSAFARRFWLDLRNNGAEPGNRASRNHGTRAPSLRTFCGIRPLRYWLAERLLGSLEQELGRANHHGYAAGGYPQGNGRLDRRAHARTLRMPGMAVRAEAKAT